MNSIIDIYNSLLFYNENKINYIIDKDNNIWFKFISIATILNYKSIRDTLRDNVANENKRRLKEIDTIIKTNDHPNTIYINESGLYTFLIKSKMKNAHGFQLWLVNEVLPNLRKHGKYEVNKRLKNKLKTLNKKIKILEKENLKLKNSMTKHKYPKGTHVYALEDDKMYKIGYTDDLEKRLATYNTGNANKASYAYYAKTKCGKEIEKCMKAILNKYIYKSNKEFYNCNLPKIIEAINICLKAEKKCNKCNDLNNIQTGGQSLIDILIYNYKKEYDYYNTFSQ
jgi:prophage antirepressor-like protein